MQTVRVLSTLALKGAVMRFAGQYEAAKGVRIDADFAPTIGLLPRLRGGEKADIVILTREGLDELAAEGTVVATSVVDLARSYVGIAVRAGAPHPDIATEEEFHEKKPLVCLLTDFGLMDHYVGVMKAVLLDRLHRLVHVEMGRRQRAGDVVGGRRDRAPHRR